MTKVHVQVWTGSGSARITDMENAGKRGRKCRQLRFIGWLPQGGNDEARRAFDETSGIIHYLRSLDGTEDYDEVRHTVRGMVQDASMPEHCMHIHDDEIRGVDAPKPELTAGRDGKWGATADSDGVSVSDYVDQFNMPRSITHDQTSNSAYAKASKVWDRLESCESYHEACRVLSEGGCRLHSYCAMD